MKTQIFAFAITFTLLMAGTFLTGCEPAAQSEDLAEVSVEDAQQDLKEAQQTAIVAAQKAATAEEWQAFKSDSEATIIRNEDRIAELKVRMKKPGKTLDKVYANRIDALEQQNKDLKSRMITYEQNQSDWSSFKREFNHDMDKLGKALEDLTTDNKN